MADETKKIGSTEPTTPAPTLKGFFESTPPGMEVEIADVLQARATSSYRGSVPVLAFMRLPKLYLHCETKDCDGNRFFSCAEDEVNPIAEAGRLSFLRFTCNNCHEYTKTFALRILRPNFPHAKLYKFGETPQFGPPLPSRLVTLLRDSSDLLSQGRRCENQSMGIGAFVYYRRVLDNQRVRILDELIKVAQTLKADSALIDDLEVAKKESRFKESIERIKHALPESLLIAGENPLTMLHNALSDGIHSRSDAECLELATAIRRILSELAERLAQHMTEDKNLHAAVAKLRAKRGAGP